MEDKNKLVSASNDKTIKIWSQQFNNWCFTQTLFGHLDLIFCLLLSQKGDLIISGGLDKSIHFGIVMIIMIGVSLKQFQNTKKMQIIQTQVKLRVNQFHVEMIIQFQLQREQLENGKSPKRSIIYTDLGYASQLTICLPFSQKSSEQLQIFKYDSQHQQFFQVNEIQMKHNKRIKADNFLFPSRFINQKQVFVNKFKNNIHIIRKFGEEELKIENCIEFKDQFHFGTLSDDGEYLVIWSYETKEIQVRLYKEIFAK